MATPQEDWEHMRRIAQYLFGSPANAFKPEDFFVLESNKDAPPWRPYLGKQLAYGQPQTETYVIGKPTDDCDGILIARTDDAGNVSLEIA